MKLVSSPPPPPYATPQPLPMMTIWREMVAATSANPSDAVVDAQLFTEMNEVLKVEMSIGEICDERIIRTVYLLVPKGSRIAFRTSNKD